VSIYPVTWHYIKNSIISTLIVRTWNAMLNGTKYSTGKWAPCCSIRFTTGSKVKFHNFSTLSVDKHDLATLHMKQVPVTHNVMKTL
jgi:hypothetical protein